ncbi:MAG: acetoin utilization protein AcuC [Chitinispirillaceae bacterium]|nr:acetoin utilization protein AcuC [Chitinispirillaceae bacterium]
MDPASRTCHKALFIHSDRIERYHYPPECPFKTGRAGQTRAMLRSMGLYESEQCGETAPRPATKDELLLFHDPAYLHALERVSRGDLRIDDLHRGLGTEDCPVFKDLYDYATLASGGTIRGAELLIDNTTRIAFNPSGGYHHAMTASAGGFCYINDVVLACMVFSGSGRKVFCLDLDAHHGNGTQAAFYGDPRVCTVSFHESGKTLFPWSGFEDEIGEGAGRGYNVNVPLPAGTDDDTFVTAFGTIVPPLLDAFDPDVIVLEIGMDILSVDPLTHLNMTNNALADTLPLLVDRHIPILAVGGGGYHPEHTARGWALAWTILCGNEPDNDMSIGMGGVFLGSAEWSAGLRDGRIYARGEEKVEIGKQVEETVKKIQRTVFPIFNL